LYCCDINNLKRRIFYFSSVSEISAHKLGRAWWSIAAVRKERERENISVLIRAFSIFSFYSIWAPSLRDGAALLQSEASP
jgi:hypothetical protein